MSGTDLRKIMNLMESIEDTVEETVEESEQLEEGIRGMDTDALLWEVFNLGTKYSSTSGNGKFYNKATEIIEQLVEVVGPNIPRETVSEETLEETGNANAQQKGINFSGTPATKNKGDMDLSSPKSKAAGSKTPLAQAKSGTNVGQKKA